MLPVTCWPSPPRLRVLSKNQTNLSLLLPELSRKNREKEALSFMWPRLAPRTSELDVHALSTRELGAGDPGLPPTKQSALLGRVA